MIYESIPGLPFLTGIVVLTSLYITWCRGVHPLLRVIPTVGFSDPILSYLSAFQSLFGDGTSMLKEGYQKAKPGLFKVATFGRWVVVVSGSELIEDVRKATDDALSNFEPLREFVQAEYTFGYLDPNDTYHTGVVRSKLTRNIAPTFEQVYDELLGAVRDCIPTIGEEWTKVSVLPTTQRLVCRISSRVFVGAPLCRNPVYQTLAIKASLDVVKSAFIIARFPKFLKPVVARFVTTFPSYIRQTKQFLRPIIEDRLAKMEELGETWKQAPNDLLMWLMNEAKGVEKSVDGLARRMLLMNFASIHTTTHTFIQVLYRVLANPEYIEPLRQEVEAVVAKEGWTKAGMDKMYKIDSFVRETQRVDVLAILGVSRVAVRPFTFSNGVTIPTGTLVSLPIRTVHRDGEIHPDAHVFDGFRYSKLREQEGDGAVAKHLAVSTSVEHLAFGIGRHACPGRYLATIEMKVLLAHILVTYDIKFEDGKGVPPELRMGAFRFPGNTNLLFRKRRT